MMLWKIDVGETRILQREKLHARIFMYKTLLRCLQNFFVTVSPKISDGNITPPDSDTRRRRDRQTDTERQRQTVLMSESRTLTANAVPQANGWVMYSSVSGSSSSSWSRNCTFASLPAVILAHFLHRHAYSFIIEIINPLTPTVVISGEL